MKGAIMQPYFFPYIGYYQLAYEVEKFVFLDDVTFIKQGYINRNSILMNGRRHEFSVPVSKISSYRRIDNHEYTGDFTGFLRLIEQNYKKAPHFPVVMPLIEEVALHHDNNVARKNAASVMSVFKYIGMARDFAFSSNVRLKEGQKGQDRILALCKELEFLKYRNAIGGKNLYSYEAFSAAGIELKFIQSNIQSYTQGNHEFISNLSIIDVLMHCDKPTILKHLSDFSLV